MSVIYDEIIVGAGSSGAVLAARLSEDPERAVLLLEAGPDYATLEATPADLLDGNWVSLMDHDWRLKATAIAGREIDYPRGKVTGGSSAVNGTIALRGVPADYDEWEALGNPAWNWQAVLPYFRKLETDEDERGDFHGSSGPLSVRRWQRSELLPLQAGFLDTLLAMGFPEAKNHNDPESTGVGSWVMNRRGSVRISTAIAYLLAARSRLNLTLRPECFVRRVLLEGNRAVGVEVECGGELQRVYGRRITLSAGAIASPAILLHSGIGPRADLEALGIESRLDLPGVGANLIDHPQAAVLLLPKPGVCDTKGPSMQVGLRTTAPGSGEANDLQLYMLNYLDLASSPEMATLLGSPLIFAVLVSLQRPHSRGSVSLTSSDPHVQPRIELNYLADPEDMRRMVEGLRLAWRVSQSPAIAAHATGVALLSEPLMARDDAVEGYLSTVVSTLFHPVGTARMGPEGDAGAVVDERCRVRGVEGLQVVDASVMPSIPRANTNLTCLMIGERVADWMREAPPA